jgi:uncharacterized protein YjbJ (UPF0337 family)
MTAVKWDQIKGDWQQLSVKLRERWRQLTDDDLSTIAGRRDQLVVVLQKRYDYEKNRAETELDKFIRQLTS